MSVSYDYSTGCYSISPCFAWWYSSIHRVDKFKESNEAKRIVEEVKEKDAKSLHKIKEGTISVYA